jgi:lipoprotein NlpI
MSRFRVPGSAFHVPRSTFHLPRSTFRVGGSWFCVLWLACASGSGQSPQALLNRGVSEFEQGRFAASAAAFDELAKVIPDRAPDLWQRGIALYYAGRYADCRRQFESHRTVNPDDVENAAWHFLCVAREQNPTAARASLLPVGPDSRVPMYEVYEMFRGAATPGAVMKAASGDEGQFYGNLYVGLFLDATGQRAAALPHIKAAAADRFAPIGGYMHMVARVHLKVLGAGF